MHMVRLYPAQEDVRIKEDAHLASSVIKAFPANSFIRKRGRVRHALGRIAPYAGSVSRRQRNGSTWRHLFFKKMSQVIRQRHALFRRHGGKAGFDVWRQFNGNRHGPHRRKCIVALHVYTSYHLCH